MMQITQLELVTPNDLRQKRNRDVFFFSHRENKSQNSDVKGRTGEHGREKRLEVTERARRNSV